MPKVSHRPFVPRWHVGSRPGDWARAIYYRYVLANVVRALPLETSARLARVGGRFLWKHVPLIRDGARRTIENALRDFCSPEQIERIAETHAADIWLQHIETEVAHRLLRERTWRRHVRLVGAEPLLDAVRNGRGVVGASVYLGNHQVGMTALGLALQGRVAGVVSPWQHSTQQRWMAELVRRRLAVLYPRGDAFVGAQQALRDGRLVLIICEHRSKGSSGVEVDFLGRRERVHPAPAMWCWRTGQPIAVLTCRRLARPFTFELRVHDWIERPASADRRVWIEATTARVMGVLETAIRQAPEQYAWVNRHLLAGADRPAPSARETRKN